MVAGPSKDPGPKDKKLNFKINTNRYRILAAINICCSIIDQQNNERQGQRRQDD